KIGILVRKGNPKKINSVKDFLRDDVVIINRNKGSGTRVLLDKLLKQYIDKNPEKIIRGYTYEVKTHSAVATAILQGRADAGISLEAMARFFDLDFIPIGEEIYDFIVRKDKLNNPYVSKFLSVLSTKEFASELERRLPGYKALPNSGMEIYP
ncbi:MAG: substrate-binding domain-containing protein, partial [Caldisphaera sp.]|nr:substrate-binding domain-containing protein [Caldisphaera sp.]